MSDDNEQGGGIGVSGVVGAAGAGVAAGHYGNKYIVSENIKKAASLDPEIAKGASKTYTENFAKVMEAKPDLKAAQKSISDAKGIQDFSKVKDLKFAEAGADKLHTANFKLGNKKVALGGIGKLPSGVEAGKAVEAANVEKTLKAATTQSEKNFVSSVRSAGKDAGHGFNFKGLSTTSKGKVIGGVVAAAVVGGFVVHKLFGGKNTNRVEAERQAQQQGMGIA